MPLRLTWTLVGTATANCIVAFLLTASVVGMVIFVLSWSPLQEFLGGAFTYNWGVLLAVILCYIFGLAGDHVVGGLVGTRHSIHLRFWWMAYDFVALFLHLFGGVVTAMSRLVVGLCMLLLTMTRIDRSVTPAWLDHLVSFDGLVQAYRATIVSCHQFSNPIMIAFVESVQRDARKRREASDARRETPTSYIAQSAAAVEMMESGSRRLMCAARWRKTRFMLANPLVALYAEEIVREAMMDPAAHAIEVPAPAGSGSAGGLGALLMLPPFGSPSPKRGKSGRTAKDSTPQDDLPADEKAEAEKTYVDGHRQRLKAALGLRSPSKKEKSKKGGEASAPAPAPASDPESQMYPSVDDTPEDDAPAQAAAAPAPAPAPEEPVDTDAVQLRVDAHARVERARTDVKKRAAASSDRAPAAAPAAAAPAAAAPKAAAPKAAAPAAAAPAAEAVVQIETRTSSVDEDEWVMRT